MKASKEDLVKYPFCANCLHHAGGECHRNPPQVAGEGVTFWPEVAEDDFCGSYGCRGFDAMDIFDRRRKWLEKVAEAEAKEPEKDKKDAKKKAG